jgi:hypothetical protein
MPSLDLVSFISGIGPTIAFTPGANTPSPFNTTHTGVTDGTSPTTASLNQAELYNRILLQIASVVSVSGISIDHANWTQLPAAIQAIAATAIGTFVTTSFANPGFIKVGAAILNFGFSTNPVSSTSGNTFAVTYAEPFTVACAFACASPYSPGGNNGSAANVQIADYSSLGTLSIFSRNQETNVFWLSIGH